MTGIHSHMYTVLTMYGIWWIDSFMHAPVSYLLSTSRLEPAMTSPSSFFSFLHVMDFPNPLFWFFKSFLHAPDLIFEFHSSRYHDWIHLPPESEFPNNYIYICVASYIYFGSSSTITIHLYTWNFCRTTMVTIHIYFDFCSVHLLSTKIRP